MKKTAIIIPARYASTRLPGKPLLKVAGKTIIQHVWERASEVKSADGVIIATDDKRIYDVAKSFGAAVEMTKENHKCGSDRIAEVADRHGDFSYIINLQGDEPTINPECVETVINLVKNDERTDISTLLTKITREEAENPNNVKCVTDREGFALYFSRSVIPFERNVGYAEFYKHIGIYGYKREALFKMINEGQPFIEKSESLEQLRAMYAGMRIKTAVVEYNSIGIDTIEDYNEFKRQAEQRK